MKTSPLQLEAYFVTDLHFSINKNFDAQKGAEIKDTDVSANFDMAINAENNRLCQLTLKLQFQPAAEANTPYRFTIEMLGAFRVLEVYPEEKQDRLLRVNGPSMLFGIAREIVRDITARGPYPALILPSVSFFEPESLPEPKSPEP